MFLNRNVENIRVFYLKKKKNQFFEVKFSVYLNRRVFVMVGRENGPERGLSMVLFNP